VLGGHEHGPAPLAADPDPLDEAQGDEQDRRPHPDGVVGGEQPDADGRRAHEGHRDDQHGLAAGPVTEVPHDRTADGPGEETDGQRGEGREGAGEIAVAGEELRAEDERGRRAVDEEVVPLDRRADETARNSSPHSPLVRALLGGDRCRHRLTFRFGGAAPSPHTQSGTGHLP
jgi:hypothetical protein